MICPACSYPRTNLLYSFTRSGAVHQCRRCGFGFSDPDSAKTQTLEKPATVDSDDIYAINAADRLAFLKRTTGIEKGRILDVGCYTGGFAAAAKAAGFEAFGVEPDPEASQEAEQKHGVKVFIGEFESAPSELGPFDTISFIHSFEHLADPHAALQKAAELLSHDGALLIETPDFDSMPRKLLGVRWRQFIADHAFFYSPKSISAFLEAKGFSVIKIERAKKALSLGLLSDRVERYYSQAAGSILARTFSRLGIENKVLRFNPGDIMLLSAQKSVATRG